MTAGATTPPQRAFDPDAAEEAAEEAAEFARIADALRRDRVARDPDRAAFVEGMVRELTLQGMDGGGLAQPAHAPDALQAAVALRFDFATIDEARG